MVSVRMAKSKRSKATDISQKTKYEVWERDNHRCIFCGSPQAMPNAHVISRAYSGLGVVRNIVTACMDCHRKMDQSTNRKAMIEFAKNYLKSIYEDWCEEELIYKKYGGLF